MAKHKDNPEANPAPENPNPETPATPATPVTAVADDRYVTLTTDGRYGTSSGTTVKRIDLIRALWQNQKLSRGAIAKYLTELSGKKIPYQIVFSGTKGLAGGPDKVNPVPVQPVSPA